MNSEVTVDIIIPNYNKALYLKETINSVINQKFKNWNLYIIDNNSTDESKKILQESEKVSKKIKIIYLKKNKGVSFSRNLGLRISTAQYLCFLDSDDLWLVDKLEQQVNFMVNRSHVFTYTNFIPFITIDNKKFLKKIVSPPNKFSYKEFILNTSIATSTMMIKRNFFRNIKFPKVKSFEDYIFKCSLLKKTNAIKLDVNTTHYRILKKSLSSSKFQNIFWLFILNRKYNNLSFIENIKSIIFVSINSIKKYGFK